MDLSEINGLNDRRNLFLLLYKEVKTMDDEMNIVILKNQYPDIVTEKSEVIIRDLMDKGFLESIDLYPDLPVREEEIGYYIHYDFERCKIKTSDSGIHALNIGYFPSECKSKNLEIKRKNKEDLRLDLSIDELKRNKFLSWAAFIISIAAIAISIISLLKK